MKLTNTYYAKRRDQILIVANAIIITICAVGSILGLIRIGELKAEQKKLGAAIEWLELGNRLADQVQRAKADLDHPTRGLVAISNAIYRAIDAQMKGGGSLMLKRFHVWTTDFREFYVDAYSRHHAELKVAEITNGRAVIAGVREIR